jgi:hypothetical protein
MKKIAGTYYGYSHKLSLEYAIDTLEIEKARLLKAYRNLIQTPSQVGLEGTVCTTESQEGEVQEGWRSVSLAIAILKSTPNEKLEEFVPEIGMQVAD